MKYISVKEAAKKFKISERRVQQLCELNRIENCKMLKGEWLIPEDATKPADERTMPSLPDPNYITLSQLCSILSISIATGKNWIKLKKIVPSFLEKKTPFFHKEYAEALKQDILSGNNDALKSRRNKKFVSGNALYKSYVSEECQNLTLVQKLLSEAEQLEIIFNDQITQYLVADCAIKLFLQKNNEKDVISSDAFKLFLERKISLKEKELIDSLIANKKEALSFYKKYTSLFSQNYLYEKNEDILGLIYISCKNLGNRKSSGAYYTPTKIVKRLISSLDLRNKANILDPCCGTGNFLLQLPDGIKFDSVFGSDIDPISVKIARINMSLKFPEAEIKEIIEHIAENDFLKDFQDSKFHLIIGNPPWGFDFAEDEKLFLCQNFKSAESKGIESYDIFVEQALKLLVRDGELSFVIPEALLNVRAHFAIRKIISEQTNILGIDYLGNAFDSVQCPSIILRLKNTQKKLSTVGMTIQNDSENFTININREISPEYFSFNINDRDFKIIQKIKNHPNHSLLAEHADFALGIVTGNNKELISSAKNKNNEAILKGSNICKFHIKPSDNYIIFDPKTFQQVAPTEMYRAPEKLFYRFISNQLVFAYDNHQMLSLNSCNILIPKIQGLNIKYIMAVLNSRVAQFFFKKEFNSIKVLRSHIESIPIPNISLKEQKQIISLVDKLIEEKDLDAIIKSYNKLDSIISDLFYLTKKEQEAIEKIVDSENRFFI